MKNIIISILMVILLIVAITIFRYDHKTSKIAYENYINAMKPQASQPKQSGAFGNEKCVITYCNGKVEHLYRTGDWELTNIKEVCEQKENYIEQDGEMWECKKWNDGMMKLIKDHDLNLMLQCQNGYWFFLNERKNPWTWDRLEYIGIEKQKITLELNKSESLITPRLIEQKAEKPLIKSIDYTYFESCWNWDATVNYCDGKDRRMLVIEPYKKPGDDCLIVLNEKYCINIDGCKAQWKNNHTTMDLDCEVKKLK